MIVSAFLSILDYFFSLILSVFPDGSGFPDTVHASAQQIGGYVGILNPIFPIDTLYQILILVIVIEVAILGFKTLKWIISHVPFIGGRG